MREQVLGGGAGGVTLCRGGGLRSELLWIKIRMNVKIKINIKIKIKIKLPQRGRLMW
jgi:hypothetical protein